MNKGVSDIHLCCFCTYLYFYICLKKGVAWPRFRFRLRIDCRNLHT